MNQHLGIGMVGHKPVTRGLQFLPQFPMIVNFTVEDHPDACVLVAHRLIAGRKIHDREATKT